MRKVDMWEYILTSIFLIGIFAVYTIGLFYNEAQTHLADTFLFKTAPSSNKIGSSEKVSKQFSFCLFQPNEVQVVAKVVSI